MDNRNTFSSLDNFMINQNPLLMDLIPSREDSTSFSTMLPLNSMRSDPLQMGGYDIFNSFLTNNYSSSTSSPINVQESFEIMAPPPSFDHLDQLRPYDDSSNIMWSFGENSGFHAYSCVQGGVGPSEPIASTFAEEDVSDECSEISPCAAAKSNRIITSEQASSSSKDISNNVSQVVFGSTYLHSVQEILSQFATYSLNNLENNPQCYFSSQETQSGAADSAFTSRFENQTEFLHGGFDQRRALEAKKTHLLGLLQMMDDKYSHCVDEIHTVVSAFHAATELDPQLHTRFALQTISFIYKNLRERISKKILIMGSVLERGKEKSQEHSIINQHCLLQQLKQKNHHIWRPQRGLPEKSVSVLRTWMFQNFLHPYPTDSEKHLLAIRSGLTRSQVRHLLCNSSLKILVARMFRLHKSMQLVM
ncbi:Homeobox protein ATH1 [Hirschfeldia incana]|nr:Homeobox protein ATH1 [Hirschfeldia incana]